MQTANRTARIVIAGALSLAAISITRLWPPGAPYSCAAEMVRAAQLMEHATLAIRNQRQNSGLRVDLRSDPNGTGLIGPQYSPLMTTAGELEAKRTTTNPNIAGLLVYWLHRAGVKPGDSIAIGSSGSFPALLVASLAAAKAMDVKPVTILSLGASSYGATDPDFDLFDIYNVLLREHLCNGPPDGVSIGGDRDIGLDLEADVIDRLVKKIQSSSSPFLHEPELAKNVSRRLEIYQRNSPGNVSAFINSGGGYANLGTSSLVLDVHPGLNTRLALPREEERGVLFEMSARKIPVIHLLYVKGLVMQAGLPWDPVPLPKPGMLYQINAAGAGGFWVVSAAYFALLLLLLIYRTVRQ